MEHKWWNELREYDKAKKPLKAFNFISEAIKIPELDIIVKASKQKNYKFYGTALARKIESTPGYKTTINPNIQDILILLKLLQERARHNLESGDKANAETDMFATIRTGHILQKSVNQMMLLTGVIAEYSGMDKMPDFYRKLNDENKARNWELFIPKAKKHKEENRKSIMFSTHAELEALKKAVDDDSLPRSFRMACLSSIQFKAFFTIKPRIRFLSGEPKKVMDYVNSVKFNDEEMEALRIELIEAFFLENGNNR